MYRIILSDQARKEYLYFSQSGNKIILNKITVLLNDIAAFRGPAQLPVELMPFLMSLARRYHGYRCR